MQARRLAQRATKNDNTPVNFYPINGKKNSRYLNSPTVSRYGSGPSVNVFVVGVQGQHGVAVLKAVIHLAY